MRWRSDVLILVALLISVLGCQGWSPGLTDPGVQVDPALEASPAPWTSLDLMDADTDFDFVVVTDRTGEHREGVFREAMKKVNLIQPAFVLSVGDLIEGYTDDRQELVIQWEEIGGMVAPLEMPFFYAAGNHDMSNSVMSELWRERFGPSYYSFVYKDVLFVILNSELFGMVSDPRRPVPGPETQAEQMAWVEGVLNSNRERRHTFVIIHQPLWDRSRPHPDWERVESLLGKRPYTVLAGHVHAYTADTRHDRRYITLATTGGGSELRGLDHGEFDHVMLVSMRDDGPVLANLLLDGIHDEDVRTAETRKRLKALEKAVNVIQGSSVDPNMKRGSVTFEVTNSSEESMGFAALFESAGNLRVEASDIAIRLAPGETRRFRVDVKAGEGSQDLRDTATPMGHFTLQGVRENGVPLVLERSAWLLPLGQFAIPRASGEIRVDGELEEWGSLPFRSTGPDREEEGASFRYAVAHDDDFLYLAVNVKDSTPVHSEELTARKQDAVRFNVDARPDPERSASGQGYFEAIMDGTLGQLVTGWVAPVSALPDNIAQRWLPPLPKGSEQASEIYEGGYTVEFAIPSAWLDQRQGKAWEFVRIELSVQDFSAPGAHPEHILFRPGRFDGGGALPVPGSATFERVLDSR